MAIKRRPDKVANELTIVQRRVERLNALPQQVEGLTREVEELRHRLECGAVW